MSERADFTLASADGTKLSCYEWPCPNARATVVIVHGMAEHAARYGRFAEALNKAGFAVFSMDLRGHGATALGGIKGWFAKRNGGPAVLEDIRLLSAQAQEKYPASPLILFGHSMGSIFARAAMYTYGELYRAVVLSGVTVDIPVRRNIAPFIAGVASFFQGSDKPSVMLDSLTFGSYNKPYQPARTKFEWLSRDGAEVDKYVSDENCGFICTGSMFVDISRLLLKTLKKANVDSIPKALPVLIISGGEDPAGMNGAAARFLEQQYKEAGLAVDVKIYDKARHELLNEINRDEVTGDVIGFMSKVIGN